MKKKNVFIASYHGPLFSNVAKFQPTKKSLSNNFDTQTAVWQELGKWDWTEMPATIFLKWTDANMLIDFKIT